MRSRASAFVAALSACVALDVAGGVVVAAGQPAALKLPAVIGENMVLQRDAAIPVWGTAQAGRDVTVAIEGQKQSVAAGKDGKWIVRLAPMKAGGPFVMKVSSDGTELVMTNVLVGEVWAGSGQSNMEHPISTHIKGDAVLAQAVGSAPYAQLRLKSGNGAWQEATEATLAPFSALLFSYGLRLQQELGVPVGLVSAAVGATPAAVWVSQKGYDNDPACQEIVRKLQAGSTWEQDEKKYRVDMDAYLKARAAKQPAGAMPRAPIKPGAFRGGMGGNYNGLIKPLMPYAIRGVLWDQGEYGSGIMGVDQYAIMGALIRSWRADWGQGEFPFLYVQKPSGGGCAWDPNDPVTRLADKPEPLPEGETKGGTFRANFIRIMNYSNTFMVGCSDLGGGTHPANKSGYGARAARVALGAVYGRPVEICGPTYRLHTIDGQKVRVVFSHVGKGLALRGDRLQGFAVAGEDKVFQWAEAAIESDAVVLSSEKVAAPKYVRYAWAEKMAWANLFNKDGLPALSFSTEPQ